jgi:hypothetical protein
MYGDVNDVAIPQSAGKESLAKATKDLMSLDAVKWSNPPQSPPPHPLYQNIPPSPHTQHLFSHINHQQSRNHNQLLSHVHHPPNSPSISIAPLRTVSAPSPPHPEDVPSSSSSPASIPMSASPPTPFENYPPQQPVSKRPPPDETHRSNKRPRPSHASTSQSISSIPPKPTLLSPSQKKANHIQSEQKRRANIRRGYEALCDTIPALREAIRLEDESSNGASGSGNGRHAAGSKGKKKTRGKLLCDDGEKVDGRAGPRSENVVLQKSKYLLAIRSARILSSNADRIFAQQSTILKTCSQIEQSTSNVLISPVILSRQDIRC